MGLQPIIDSLRCSMKVLFTSVSSMNLEPVVNVLWRTQPDFFLCRYDHGKEAQYHYDGEVDHNILSKVDEVKPDVIIYSGPAAGKCKPQDSTFAEIKKSARTIALVCDGGCPDWHPILREYAANGLFDRMVNIDGNPNWPSRACDFTFVGLIDPVYYGLEREKTIRFGFAGGDGAKSRRDAISILKEKCGLVIGERSEAWGTYENYAQFMLRTKSVVNFPETGSQKTFHVKYRIIESGLAKCCVFERKNPITELYFEPGKDYVEYETIDDLVEKVNSISDEEMISKAQSLHDKVVSQYGADKAWKKVFESLV